MAYDDLLARRIEARLGSRPGFQMKKMFGGIGYMLHGNMACGIIGSDLMVRVGVDNYEAALAEPHVGDMSGRPMRGWVVVRAQGIAADDALHGWIERGVAVAEALPPK
jgi:hypothetical protein